jgi:Ca2+/Na+ antiporter
LGLGFLFLCIIFTPAEMVQKSLLYLIAVVLVAGWALAFLYWHIANKSVHIVLLIAVAAAAIAFFKKEDQDNT